MPNKEPSPVCKYLCQTKNRPLFVDPVCKTLFVRPCLFPLFVLEKGSKAGDNDNIQNENDNEDLAGYED